MRTGPTATSPVHWDIHELILLVPSVVHEVCEAGPIGELSPIAVQILAATWTQTWMSTLRSTLVLSRMSVSSRAGGYQLFLWFHLAMELVVPVETS